MFPAHRRGRGHPSSRSGLCTGRSCSGSRPCAPPGSWSTFMFRSSVSLRPGGGSGCRARGWGTMPPVTIRIGLVGAGFIAGRHLDSLACIDGVTVAGVADPRTERAEVLAARSGATSYPAWEVMLDAEDLEALYVC